MTTLLRHLTAVALFCALATAAFAQTPRVIEFTTRPVVSDELSVVRFWITVTPPLEPSQKVQVRLKVVDGTARRGEDFKLSADSFLLTLAPGGGSSEPADPVVYAASVGLWYGIFAPIDDGIHEPDETFTLTLSEPGPGAVLGERSSLTATIRNSPPTLLCSVRGSGFLDSPPPGYPLSGSLSDPLFIREDVAAANPLEFAVMRHGDREGAVSADLEFVPGGSAEICDPDCEVVALPPALPGVHFQAANQRVSFASGETEPKRILVPILPDGEPDGDRFFTVRLRNAAEGTAIGPDVVVGILDNERPTHLDVAYDPRKQPLVHFAPAFSPSAVFQLPSGKSLVRGAFTAINGTDRPGLARLHPDGELDETFNPPASLLLGDFLLHGLHPPNSERILVQILGGTSSGRLIRLLEDGTVDPGFNPQIPDSGDWHGPLTAIVPDGTIWSVRGPKLYHLSADGSLLSSVSIEVFPVDPAAQFQEVLGLQPVSGQSLVVGNFPGCDPDVGNCVHRLLHDGNLDPGFSPISGTKFWMLPDGRVVVREGDSIRVRIHLPDGRLDLSFPPLRPGGIGNGKRGDALFVPGTQPYLTGGSDGVNGIPRDANFAPRLRLSGLPQTALQLTVGPLGFGAGLRDFLRQPEPAANETGSFIVRFYRLGSSAAPASVHYTTRDVTATAGKDYLAQSGTIIFAPLEVEKIVEIPILTDSEDEFHETLEVVVTGGEGFEELPAPMRLTILGNGPALRLERVRRLRDGHVILGPLEFGNGFLSPANAPSFEFSADLKTWQSLHNAVEGIGLDGHPVWLDASSTNAPTRYYRAVTQ